MTNLNKGYKVPLLPDDLPFSPDQQQWLGGFLAGLHSRLLVVQANAPQVQTTVVQKPITIIYGSQTGNAESLAYDCAESAEAVGLVATVLDMDDVELSDLASVERLVVVTSTYGEGEMPDNALSLWDDISADDAPKFENTYFSVLALGDTSYDEFCSSGKQWDERLLALGATRVVDRLDCDIDYESIAEEWIGAVLPVLESKGSAAGTAAQVTDIKPDKTREKSKYNRKNPLLAKLTSKRTLTGLGSSKEVLHYELSLAESGESYNAGDALNIIPSNQPALVQELLAYFKCGKDQTCVYNDENISVDQLFTDELEIRTPPKALIKELAARSQDAELNSLLEGDVNLLNDFLYGKDTLDLLKAYAKSDFTLDDLISFLKPMAHRAYSISSSINTHQEEVHLTVASVRYEKSEREHLGVCSTYLADLLQQGDTVKCFFSANKAFSVPEDNDAPVIMVGPGTGIAPFRSFLEERQSRSAKGQNWLFFGDRNQANDFLYQQELEAMQATGLLSKLDLAFSRDQAEKIYVQDRIREQGAELFAWLEKGAYFFICGDALRMAKDVDAALHEIIEQHGKMGSDAAEDYVSKLRKAKRYVRDVY